MSEIHTRFEESYGLADLYRGASVELDSLLAEHLPTRIDAGEASDAMSAVLIALVDNAANLAVYGQGVAGEAEGALAMLSEFESSTVLDLRESLAGILGIDVRDA